MALINSMIVTEIRGGLGNQLFIYAAAKSLALKNGCELSLDCHSHDINDTRTFDLHALCIPDKVLTEAESISLNQLPKYGTKLWFKRTFERLLPLYMRSIYTYNSFDYLPVFTKIKAPIYLKGYWQSEKYFKSYENEIRNLLKFKNPIPQTRQSLVEYISSHQAVSLHVRRTDYLEPNALSFFDQVTPAYYDKAVKSIESKVERPHLIVFSDDIEWAKSNLKYDLPMTFVNPIEGKDYEDLRLMSLCKHHIIPNSTFSWWGAWLSNYEGKLVIAPENWVLTENNDCHGNDIIPESWIKAPNS